MATATIGRWGNANAIRIPKALCEEVGLSADDLVSIEAKKNKIVIQKKADEFTLQSLMKSWDSKRYSAEEIDWGTPQGNEMW